MSEESARRWLSTHHDIIPALEVNHRRALEVLRDHHGTRNDLADVIARDPGMSVSLYHQVNSAMHGDDEHNVESVHAALARLGDSAIADLVMQHRVLDQAHPDAVLRQGFHQLMSRCYHLLAQLEGFVAIQGIRALNEIRSAALLHNIGEFCACLFDSERYRRYQDQYRRTGSDVNSARAVYGFDFHALGRLYANKSCLPPLVTESLDDNVPPGRMGRLIQLAADISHQAETGWYHPAMKATQEVSAAWLNQSLDGFGKGLHQVAIECARTCPFDDVLPAAARLIMLPERERPTQPPPRLEAGEDPATREFEQRVKILLHTHRPTPAQTLNLLLDHLHGRLHLARVALLLTSRDGGKLGTRAGRGIDRQSPIRNLVIDLDDTSLLQSMLSPARSLWVKTDNYRQYEASLPARFRDAFLHENFFLAVLAVSG